MLLKGLATVLFATSVVAEGGLTIYHNAELAVSACESLIEKSVLYFPEEDEVGFCTTDLQQALGSIAHCLKQLPHPQAEEAFLKECSLFGITQDDLDSAYKNATKYLVSNVTADPDYVEDGLYYKPVNFTDARVNQAYLSSKYRFLNYNYLAWFGTALTAYWFGVLLVAGVCNWTYFLAPSFVKSLNGTVSNTFRKYISLPALGRKHHAHHKLVWRVFQFMVPTRLESILIGGWLVMGLAFCISHIDYTDGDLFWPTSKSANIGRKIADRTGIMALFLVPELILFAGRNNFLQWVSGWSYSRFNLLHRWVSRLMTMFSFLHGVGMYYNAIGIGKLELRNAKPYVRWGYVALVAACILCFHSLMVFRRKQYELFLAVHIVMAVFFLAGMWLHAGSADQGYVQWGYAAAAVWCFDRAVRIFRLAAFGVRTAQVQLIAGETLRVTVSRPGYWKPFPGCHAFIHFLRPSCFWQSHPFTIVDSDTSKNTITFYLKVKGGLTHGLYQYLAKQPDNKANIKVSVEGPYGNRIPVHHYDTAVFVAGGNGIPGLYSEATDLVRRGGKQHVKFYWVIRHYKSIEWFYDELLRLKDAVQPVIYVTQPHVPLEKAIGGPATGTIGGGEVDADDEKKTELTDSDDDISGDHLAALKSKLSFVEFREGRPLVGELITGEIAEAEGSIAFVTCAHADLVDEARATIKNNLGAKRVELFEQLQTW